MREYNPTRIYKRLTTALDWTTCYRTYSLNKSNYLLDWRHQFLGRPHISELELEFLLQAQRLQQDKKLTILSKYLGYKRPMATMAELIAIEHTHETAVITFLTGGMDWSSSHRLTDYSKTLTWYHFTIGWCQDSTHI